MFTRIFNYYTLDKSDVRKKILCNGTGLLNPPVPTKGFPNTMGLHLGFWAGVEIHILNLNDDFFFFSGEQQIVGPF